MYNENVNQAKGVCYYMKHKCVSSVSKKKRRRRNRIKRIWRFVGILGCILLVILLCSLIFPLTVWEEKDMENTESDTTEVLEEVQNVEEELTEVVIEDEETKRLKQAKALLDEMTLEERVYQMFIVTPEQLTGVEQVTQSGNTTKAAIEKHPVGGIIYFAGNLISREQCSSMIQNIQSYSKTSLFIAVDEEGGKVARVGKNPEMGTTSFQPMGEIGATEDVSKAYEVGYTIGTDISELGFNLDFAPVADVFSNPDNTVIGDRAFSSDPQIAAEMVASCVRGFNDSGILCTLKHFPGHGDTISDSHYGEVKIEKTLEELFACELIPFQAGIDIGVPFVMIGHLTVPQVTEEDCPATLSYEIVTELLREEMGFEGIVITDSMQMQAITDRYSSGTAAVKAIEAGVDIILMPQNLQDAVDGVLAAVENETLTEERIEESVLRILQMKISKEIIKIDTNEM